MIKQIETTNDEETHSTKKKNDIENKITQTHIVDRFRKSERKHEKVERCKLKQSNTAKPQQN